MSSTSAPASVTRSSTSSVSTTASPTGTSASTTRSVSGSSSAGATAKVEAGSIGSNGTSSSFTTLTTSASTSTNSTIGSTVSRTPTLTLATSTPTASSYRSSSSLPSTTTGSQYGTLVATESVFLVSATASTETFTSETPVPTVSLPPLPTITTSITPDPPDHETHEFILDVGNCAGIGTPTVMEPKGYAPELTPLGGGKYSVVLGERDNYDSAYSASIYLADSSSKGRCGTWGLCTTVYTTFGLGGGIDLSILSAGERSLTMYPFSIWMDGAVTFDGRPANTPETASHCWGWTEEECPNALTDDRHPEWTIFSKSSTARAYVSFCPPDGPALSDVGPNPSPNLSAVIQQPAETFILVSTVTTIPVSTIVSTPKPSPSATRAAVANSHQSIDDCSDGGATTCILHNTFISLEEVSTISTRFTKPVEAGRPTQTTYIELDTTMAVPVTTFTMHRASLLSTSRVVESTGTARSTDPSEWAFAPANPSPSSESSASPSRTRTKRPSPTETVTDSAEPTTETPVRRPTPTSSTGDAFNNALPPDATITTSDATITPPASYHVLTSWTTWIEVNGSTIPAIAGEAGIETTVPVTYMLDSSTIIPVDALSSISVESTRTASTSPTPSVAASQDNSSNPQSKIAGAVVGTLVGLTLGSILIWFICYKRRRGRSRDYLSQVSPSWGNTREDRLLDLDAAPMAGAREQEREMVVQPWVAPVSVARRKDMERSAPASARADVGTSMGGDGYDVTGPSHELDSGSTESGHTSEWTHFQTSSEHLSPVMAARAGKVPSRSQSQYQPPSRSRSQSSQPQRPELAHFRHPSLANPSDSLLPTPFEVGTPPASPLRRVENVERQNAIPPLYNEAWNTVR